jgi:hypothetical protein
MWNGYGELKNQTYSERVHASLLAGRSAVRLGGSRTRGSAGIRWSRGA